MCRVQQWDDNELLDDVRSQARGLLSVVTLEALVMDSARGVMVLADASCVWYQH